MFVPFKHHITTLTILSPSSEVSFLIPSPSPYEMLSHFSQYDSTNTGTTSTYQRLNGTGDSNKATQPSKQGEPPSLNEGGPRVRPRSKNDRFETILEETEM